MKMFSIMSCCHWCPVSLFWHINFSECWQYPIANSYSSKHSLLQKEVTREEDRVEVLGNQGLWKEAYATLDERLRWLLDKKLVPFLLVGESWYKFCYVDWRHSLELSSFKLLPHLLLELLWLNFQISHSQPNCCLKLGLLLKYVTKTPYLFSFYTQQFMGNPWWIE